MELQNSASVENFIKIIYQFENRDDFDTRSGTIAKELGITNAAATDMARKLSAKNLVSYEKYKELRLTENGKRLALEILRKHRLWESFLHEVLGLSLHEIHREAELLEHATSGFLLNKIDEYLGNPSLDPHGDPIPDKNGEIRIVAECISISKAKAGKAYEICRLIGSSKEFVDFCTGSKLQIGAQVLLKNQYPEGKMTEIEIANSKLLLNAEWSKYIFVKSI